MAATSEAARAQHAADQLAEALYTKLSPGPGRPATEVAAHQCARIHSAMVALAAERGYAAVTVRELARLAGVSTRTFYQHFSGKEDCFLRTYELIVRRAIKRIVASQAGERDWQERLRLAFGAFARELEPQAACLALVEAYAAGPAALEQIRCAERTFEAMVAESLARARDGIVVPTLVVKGIVAGVTRIARARLATGRGGELPELSDALLEWALCYRGEAVADLTELDRRAALEHSAVETMVPAWPQEGGAQAPTDDRTLILSAVAKLVVADGYGRLTVPCILAAAGVPRRRFNAHFSGVEDCFRAALELRAGEAFTKATRAGATGGSWEGGIYQAIVTLCTQVAQDPLLARLCFVDVFASGAGGMHCRERLMTNVIDYICDSAPPSRRPNEFTTEAFVGAIWGVIHHHVASGQARQLPRIAATLSFLALAPAVGGPSAIDAIRREQQSKGSLEMSLDAIPAGRSLVA
jgi:AcrR family transcriptional regulator